MIKWILSKQNVMGEPQDDRIEVGRFDSQEEANRAMVRIVNEKFPSGGLYWRACGDLNWRGCGNSIWQCYDFGSWSTFFVIEGRDVSED